MNELEKAYQRHKKKQKGMSPFIKHDAGDVEKNIEMINHMAGSQTQGVSAGDSGEAAGVGGGMGEGLTRRTLEEDIERTGIHTISELFDLVESR